MSSLFRDAGPAGAGSPSDLLRLLPGSPHSVRTSRWTWKLEESESLFHGDQIATATYPLSPNGPLIPCLLFPGFLMSPTYYAPYMKALASLGSSLWRCRCRGRPMAPQPSPS